jgi:tetratricopeptide (TPR) repeat protein
VVDGSSTPYRAQYSYQQALVMQGKVDEALASFEAIIAERPDDADVRIGAGELCAREKRDALRAADFFRAAPRVRSITSGEDVFVTNRLVDLYSGMLNEPGCALVELRRLIDRHPDSPAPKNARVALAALKSRARLSSE